MDSKEIVKSFVSATNERDWEKASHFLHSTVKRNSSTYGQPTVAKKEDLIAFHKAELETFPDLVETILFMICENDMVGARINFKGTQLGPLGQFPPSQKTLNADFNCFFKIHNDKIVEIWVEYDILNGLIQLGHYKP
ncbi:MAG: ester cyclase [Allomuricauda sp.]